MTATNCRQHCLLLNAGGWEAFMDTRDCQNMRCMAEGWGCVGFSPLLGLGSKPAEMNGKIPSGLRLFWTGLFKGACYECISTHRWLQPVLGHTCCAQPAPLSLVVHADAWLSVHLHPQKDILYPRLRKKIIKGIFLAPHKITASSGQQDTNNSPIPWL